MFKVSFFNIVCYLFIKYTLFFFVLAFIGNRFRNAVINNAETSMELMKLSLGYVLYILFYVVFLVLFFSIPLFFILKIEKKIYLVLSMIAFFYFEYFAYTYLFSPSDKMIGIYNLIIGIIVFVLIYYKSIIQILNK
jgi:hypothetical protein